MARGASQGIDDTEYRQAIRLRRNVYMACAPAKLNITLRIGALQHDGMHSITSIMQAVSLCDLVVLRRTNAANRHVEGRAISQNIVLKAIGELEAHVGMRLRCEIDVHKSIPLGAGMGGGSSDAAATLRLANTAFGLGMGVEELAEVAGRVGSDVPFLVYGGRAMVRGSAVQTIRQMRAPRLFYAIATPAMELSTAAMYALHDKTGKEFTELASELCPDTWRLLRSAKRAAPVECGVTGKGPTVFASFRSYERCAALAESWRSPKRLVSIAHSIGRFV